LRFRAGAWTAYDVSECLRLWAGDASNVWCVGGNQSAVASRWDGQRWNNVSCPGAALHAIAGGGPDDVWMGGTSGNLVRWDGQACTPARPAGSPLPGFGESITWIAMGATRRGDVWMASADTLVHRVP
jgi:hypothetical protein